VTPIQLDLTDHETLEALQSWPLDGVTEAAGRYATGPPGATEVRKEPK
jgi:hypothetical protein